MTRRNVCQRLAPEARGGLLDLGIEVAQDRLHGAHDERQADEGERHDHAERRVGDLDPERLEPAADPAVVGVDRGERDAGDRGGQRERQVDQRVDQPPAREPVALQHPGHAGGRRQVDRGRGDRRPEAQAVTRRACAAPRPSPRTRPAEQLRGLQEHRGQRDQDHEPQVEEREAERQAEARQTLPRPRASVAAWRQVGHSAATMSLYRPAGRSGRTCRRPRSASSAPSPSRRKPVDGEQLDLRELRGVLRGHRRVARPVVVPGRDLLPLGRVQVLQVGLAPPPRVLCLFATLSTTATGGSARMLTDGVDDLELALAPISFDREQRLVLPGDQHVADAALDEGDRRAARAGVEDRHVLVELRRRSPWPWPRRCCTCVSA